MNKIQAKLGANVGDITPRYNPTGTWRLTGDPAELGGSLVTRQAGQTNDKTQQPEGRLMGGPTHVMVGRLTEKAQGKERLPHKGNKSRIRIQERLVLVLLLVGLYM